MNELNKAWNEYRQECRKAQEYKMKTNDASGPAFPVYVENDAGGWVISGGMTRRQWLAGLAMQGLLSHPRIINRPDLGFGDGDAKKMAKCAYLMADTMLEYEKGEG